MDGTYTIIDNNIFHDKDLNMQQAFVFMAIISYYNKKKGYAYPSYAKLKDRAKISDNRTLIKAIRYLEENGYIEREVVKGKGVKYQVIDKYGKCADVESLELHNTPSVELHQEENYTTCKVTPTPRVKLHDVPSVKLHVHQEENYTTTSTNTIINKTNNNTITKEKIKKEKGGINALIESYTDNTDLKECIEDFIKMRTAKKKPVTDRALKMLLDKLDNLETTDDRKIKVLEQSILNSWQGIFPLKEDNQGGVENNESCRRNAEEERAMAEYRREKGQWLIDNGYV